MTPEELIAWHARQITFLPDTDNAMVQHHRDAMHCVERLRKVAERYIYIRDNHEVSGKAMEIVYGMNGSDWDSAIDAALGGEGK